MYIIFTHSLVLRTEESSFPRLESPNESSFSPETKSSSHSTPRNWEEMSERSCLYNINEDLSCVDPRRMESKFTKSGSSKTQPQLKDQSRTKSQQKAVHFSCNKYLRSRIPLSKQKLLNYEKCKTQKCRFNLGIPLKKNGNMTQFARSAMRGRRQRALTQDRTPCTNATVWPEQKQSTAIIDLTPRESWSRIKSRRSKSKFCEDTTDYSSKKAREVRNGLEPSPSIQPGLQQALNDEIPAVFNNSNIKTIIANQSLRDNLNPRQVHKLLNYTTSFQVSQRSQISHRHTQKMPSSGAQNRRNLNKSCNFLVKSEKISLSIRHKNLVKLGSPFKVKLGGGYTNGILPTRLSNEEAQMMSISNNSTLDAKTTEAPLKRSFKNTLYSQSFKLKLRNMSRGNTKKVREKHFRKLNNLTKQDISKIVMDHIGKSKLNQRAKGLACNEPDKQQTSPCTAAKSCASGIRKEVAYIPYVSSSDKDTVYIDCGSSTRMNIL
ncbi:unnamed protein product [Moneuplotes crassus]|uniref:Uncharacterized protein n=1 Tax=Euplotes crassus TaxID=5936 RepID=A0AAD1U7I2_EUPCR|nr:unnamed protein product [Moneuplotes crassus]